MSWTIPLTDLSYGPEEEAAVISVLRSRWLTMGEVTHRFEASFAEFVGVRHALAVTNATAALHLACLALDLGPGDEVILPALTFVATANAVCYTGASPRFAEILGAHDLNLSPEDVERRITQRTRAILAVHYGGYPCPMHQLMDIAARHGLAVIEDAAHAPGASLDGKALGTWGDVGCFSFFSNKNLATGEGGMLVTNRDDIAERVRLLRSHGMTALTWDRHHGHANTYDVVILGYNYRIDELRSALGHTQLEKLPAGNDRRRLLTDRYWQALRGTELELPFAGLYNGAHAAHPCALPAYHLLPILLPSGVERRRFIDRMRAAGIQTSVHYPPVHLFDAYRRLQPGVSLPTTEEVASRQVTLPLYPSMTFDQVDSVAEAVVDILQELSRR